MKILKINSQKVEKEIIKEAITFMAAGDVVLYPTDTLYGLGVNIFDENALKKLYSVKNRPTNKPISVCVSEMDWIPKIAQVNNQILRVISKLLPGPYTVILKKKDCISDLLTAGSQNIGIRIPDNVWCREISQKFPITTSSANISGEETKKSVDEILEQLNNDIALVLDAGPSKVSKPSTVIDFTVKPPLVIRKGLGDYNPEHF